MNVRFFERPILPGWVYPCTLADIQAKLAQLPEEDLEGIWAVGLAPSTRKDCKAHARYIPGEHPVIYIFSYAASLTFKQPAHTKHSEIESGLAVELTYGMQVQRIGSRWLCQWELENLRRFIVDHVLLHEVGHHVHYRQRARIGIHRPPTHRDTEQFAEAYALRLRARR